MPSNWPVWGNLQGRKNNVRNEQRLLPPNAFFSDQLLNITSRNTANQIKEYHIVMITANIILSSSHSRCDSLVEDDWAPLLSWHQLLFYWTSALVAVFKMIAWVSFLTWTSFLEWNPTFLCSSAIYQDSSFMQDSLQNLGNLYQEINWNRSLFNCFYPPLTPNYAN